MRTGGAKTPEKRQSQKSEFTSAAVFIFLTVLNFWKDRKLRIWTLHLRKTPSQKKKAFGLKSCGAFGSQAYGNFGEPRILVLLS